MIGRDSPIAGKSLEPLTTTYKLETVYNTRGNDLWHGKSVKGLGNPQRTPKGLYGLPMESVQRLVFEK